MALLLLAWPLAASGQEAAERLLLEAERSEAEGDLAAALTDYEMVSRQFPGTEVAGRALLRIVAGKRGQGDLTGATQACNRLIDDFPGTGYAAAGLFFMGEMQLDRARRREETAAARETFRRIWVLFDPVTHPDLTYRAAARVRNAELDRREGDTEGAELSYLATLEGEPISEWTMRARLGLADIYLERGDWVLAAETLQQAINEAADLGVENIAAEARARLTLTHRLMLRPAAGGKRWQNARRVAGITPGKKPSGVAATADGRIVVADESPGKAVLVAEGRTIASRSFDEAHRPFFTRDGKAWVPTGTVVWEIEEGDRRTYLGPSRAPVRRLNGGAEGIYQWFTVEQKPNRVLVHREESRIARTLSTNDPVDIATDAQGRLHVLSSRGVSRFDPAAERSSTVVSSGLSKPIAIDVDPMGNIYVLDRGGRLDVFDSRGQKLDSLGPSFPGGVALNSAVDVAVDGTGRVYLLDGKPGELYVLE